MTLIDRLGGDLPRAPVTVELDDIQATVLRYRPEPYYGTHVMLHVEDARAGREFLRRLTPHVDSAADWWQAGEPWIAVAITYSGLVALGVPRGLAAELPRSVPGGDGRARRPAPRRRGERPGALGRRRSGAGTSTSGSASSATPRRRGVAPWRWRGSSTRDFPGLTVLIDAGLRRPAGRPEPAGLQGLDRPARHRGQRRRAAARPGTGRSRPASSSSATPARPACRCRRRSRTCWGATAPSSGCASTSRASGRSTASCASTPDRGGAGTARGEAGGALAQRRAADARAGPRRPGARRRPAAQQRLHLRRRSARPAGAARLAHAAHEPARHRDGASSPT